MKATTLLVAAAFACLASTNPLAPKILLQSPTFFTLLSTRSASPIHFGSVQANETGIFIGKLPSHMCPAVENQTCPDPSSFTMFSFNNGILSLGVQVPGGQQIYVQPDGQVRYTRAGDSYIPSGAYIGGWTYTSTISGSFSEVGFNGTGGGVVFCSLNSENPKWGPWQMYANVPYAVFDDEKCLGANLLASGNYTSVNAYQYV